METLITIPKYDPIYGVILRLDGEGNYVISNPVNAFPDKEFTIETWLRAPNGQEGTILSYTLTGEKSLVIQNPSNLNIYINNIQTSATGLSVATGDWVHLAITWRSSDGQLVIYINGDPHVFSLSKSTEIQPNGSLVLGQLQSSKGGGLSDPVLANMVHLRIWNKARSQFYIVQDMFRSIIDDGEQLKWELPSPFRNFLNVSAGPNYIFAVDESRKVWRSNNYGFTWDELSQSLVYVFAVSSNIVWGIDSDNAVYYSTTNGDRFQKVSGELIQLSACAEWAMGVNSEQKIYISTDNGSTWTEPNSESRMVFVSIDTNTAYGINENGLLHRSTDRGANWNPVQSNLSFKAVQCDPAGSGILIAISKDGLLHYSKDDGETFVELDSPIPLQFSFAAFRQNVIWGIDMSNNLIFSEAETRMLLHWMLTEGYGKVAFDSSGSQNNGLFGDQAETATFPEWYVSTRLTPPKFVGVGAQRLDFQPIVRQLEMLGGLKDVSLSDSPPLPPDMKRSSRKSTKKNKGKK